MGLSVSGAIESALRALANGKVILVADDEDRENEGDFIVAAEAATPQVVNFLATEGRGLICAALPPERAQDLALEVVRPRFGPTPLHGTAFTESVDYIRGTSTGISASDRSATLKALASPSTTANDFARPGHVFPLVAARGGVLDRRGHTEASVDLCRFAGLSGVGVLCEVLNSDGTMARWPDLRHIAQKWGLVLVTVEQLVRWRTEHTIEEGKGVVS